MRIGGIEWEEISSIDSIVQSVVAKTPGQWWEVSFRSKVGADRRLALDYIMLSTPRVAEGIENDEEALRDTKTA